MKQRVVLGVSGASGAALALDCACLLARMGVAIDLVTTRMARQTCELELGPAATQKLYQLADMVHDGGDLGARIASGSYPAAGMIVAPCSMRSLAAIGAGLDDTLLTRAAGVQLKERRSLVLLAREAPLTLAHLRNMTHVSEMGGVILPPVPAFYLKPDSVQAITAQIAARAVDLLRLGPPQADAWAG
ncbi:MAG: UbiX family flavin prenyltransferase [Rhodobacteraceae bacterium]|nr:UbiX family flavin prenyltransferase [Paracoccaceae bacterium]